jgi:hypothetical protein
MGGSPGSLLIGLGCIAWGIAMWRYKDRLFGRVSSAAKPNSVLAMGRFYLATFGPVVFILLGAGAVLSFVLGGRW